MAAAEPNSFLGLIISKYHAVGDSWGANLKGYSLWLLKTMLVVQLTWQAIKLGLKQSALQDVIEDLVMVAIFGSVFWTLIVYAQNWADSFISGIRTLSVSVAGGEKEAVQVLFDSIKIADAIWNGLLSIWSPFSSALVGPVVAVCIAIVFVCGAFIYGMYVLILCEAWLVLNLGIILLGFGGLKSTRVFATSYLKYALAVGLKYLAIRCLLYILVDFIADMVNYSFKDVTEAFVVAASFIVLAFLIKTVPDALAKMVTLHSGSSAGAMTGAMVAGAGMVAGGASMGAGAAVGGHAAGLSGAFKGAGSGAFKAVENALKPKEEK